MSAENCWQCGNDFPKMELLDIPIFRKGFTIKWCFECASKQVYTDMTDWTFHKIKTIKKIKIKKHFCLWKDGNMRYACNQATSITKEKVALTKEEITCNNCKVQYINKFGIISKELWNKTFKTKRKKFSGAKKQN